MLCTGLTRDKCNTIYDELLNDRDVEATREFCQKDLFFLLSRACKRRDVDRDWLYDRCREVEENSDGYLDLWAREHYKSTLITLGMSIQDLLKDQDNTTIGIFSHTRPIAKAFLKQIKRELEDNTFLQDLFPDILYKNPKSESQSWSLDTGIIVKRKSNPKEASVEAWGIVDGQPTSKHFSILVYDDVVTKESVTTPDMIKKVTESWELSLNLGTQTGRKRYIGTRYHFNDTYKTMIDRGSVVSRVKPATENGEMDGEPVLLTKKLLMEKRRDMGPYTFGSQMLQNPVADRAMSFKREWIKTYTRFIEPDETKNWNVYVLCDPANTKKKTSDYTVMEVIGLSTDNNYYLLDAFRDRLNLTERTSKLFDLVRKWNPLDVGYEKYGMQSDIEHIEYVMEQENFRFNITPVGGQVGKEDRIRALVPVYEQGRMYQPKDLWFTDYEGSRVDYIQTFVNDEYLAFPVCVHDDMLDCRARILDPVLDAKFPMIKNNSDNLRTYTGSDPSTAWMG